jgi:hypothetical protein
LDVDDFLTDMADAIAEAGSYHIDMETLAKGMSMVMSADIATGDPAHLAMAMSMKMDAGESGATNIEMRLLDGKAYYRADTSGGMFIQSDPNDPSDPASSMTEALRAQADPLQSMMAMRDAIVRIEDLGSSAELGTEVRQFAVVIDTTKVSDTGLLDSSAGSLPGEITYIYELDDRNLLQRVTASIDISGLPTDMTVTYSHWGEKIVVETPDPSLVMTNPGS